jgi:hypothetical protein
LATAHIGTGAVELMEGDPAAAAGIPAAAEDVDDRFDQRYRPAAEHDQKRDGAALSPPEEDGVNDGRDGQDDRHGGHDGVGRGRCDHVARRVGNGCGTTMLTVTSPSF